MYNDGKYNPKYKDHKRTTINKIIEILKQESLSKKELAERLERKPENIATSIQSLIANGRIKPKNGRYEFIQ